VPEGRRAYFLGIGSNSLPQSGNSEVEEGSDYQDRLQEKRWKDWGQSPPERRNVTTGDKELLYLGNFTGPLWDSDLMIGLIHGGDYPLGFIQANPELKHFMDFYFEGRDPFHELAQFFLRPKAQFLSKVLGVTRTMFREKMIGLHLRRFKGSMALAPKVKDYGSLAIAVQWSNGWSDEETGIYIASDLASVVDELRESFPTKNFIFVPKNLTFGLQPSGNPGTIEDAWMDVFLLSFCQELILTFGSSFGSMAAGMAGVKPYWMLFGSTIDGGGRLGEKVIQLFDFKVVFKFYVLFNYLSMIWK
jgi:hypothetical protein